MDCGTSAPLFCGLRHVSAAFNASATAGKRKLCLRTPKTSQVNLMSQLYGMSGELYAARYSSDGS